MKRVKSINGDSITDCGQCENSVSDKSDGVTFCRIKDTYSEDQLDESLRHIINPIPNNCPLEDAEVQE